MTEHHKLLARQLARLGADLDTCPKWVLEFVAIVNEAYIGADVDRKLLERSVELSSQELFQANSEMRAVLSAVPDLFLWLDREGNILSVDAGDASDLVMPASQLVGKQIQGVRDSAVAAKLTEAIERVRRERAPVSLEYPLQMGGGAQRTYEARLLPLLADQMLAIVRNVTERKLAEAALANQKERLRVALRSIADGVIATDTEGRITMFNRAAEELTGWSQARAVGERVAEVFAITDLSTGATLDPVSGILAGTRPWVIDEECQLTRADGQPVRIGCSISAISDQDSDTVGVAVCFRDIGERHRAAEDRLRASKLDSVGLLAGGIAHDFNNILMSLLASASLAKLEVGRKPGLVTELLDEIETATLRARDLTQQLLTFSKGGDPVKATASLGDVVRESAVFALRGSNVRCEIEIAEDLLPVEIDTGQISQVINNLIINADQAMPDGGTLSIGVFNRPTETTAVCLEIRDEGVGIPEQYLEKIFDPYFTTKQRGSGLGLATSYSIINNHGGEMSVESEVGVGTTFRIGLPATTQPRDRPAFAGAVHRGKGHVLLMDDDESIRRITERMLGHLGYTSMSASSGQEALELFAGARRDGIEIRAIITDLTVPGGMGGIETLERIRRVDARVRAIASSGYSTDPVLAQHEDYGFDAALAKPYTIQQLSAALR